MRELAGIGLFVFCLKNEDINLWASEATQKKCIGPD